MGRNDEPSFSSNPGSRGGGEREPDGRGSSVSSLRAKYEPARSRRLNERTGEEAIMWLVDLEGIQGWSDRYSNISRLCQGQRKESGSMMRILSHVGDDQIIRSIAINRNRNKQRGVVQGGGEESKHTTPY